LWAEDVQGDGDAHSTAESKIPMSVEYADWAANEGGNHMQRQWISGLLIVFAGATFWAYTIADSLIREFRGNVTYIDLGALFVLGLISGFALGQIFVLYRSKGSHSG
jgi:hypothetical protein